MKKVLIGSVLLIGMNSVFAEIINEHTEVYGGAKLLGITHNSKEINNTDVNTANARTETHDARGGS